MAVTDSPAAATGVASAFQPRASATCTVGMSFFFAGFGSTGVDPTLDAGDASGPRDIEVWHAVSQLPASNAGNTMRSGVDRIMVGSGLWDWFRISMIATSAGYPWVHPVAVGGALQAALPGYALPTRGRCEVSMLMPNRRKPKDQPSMWLALRQRLISNPRPLWFRHASEPLALPLRPSSRLRIAAAILVLAVLLYLLELVVTGHWLAAAGMAVMGACLAWPWKREASATRPQQLVISPDGQLFLESGGQRIGKAQLHPQSLRLGSHVLLVLVLGTRRHRLLLGPDNLAPVQLAALKCRLPMGSAPAGTALHSRPASGRSHPP